MPHISNKNYSIGASSSSGGGTVLWETLNQSNDNDAISPGNYKLDASLGNFSLALDGITGDEWFFSDSNSTIVSGTNEVSIGTVSDTFTDQSGNYVAGPFIIDEASTDVIIFKSGATSYDIIPLIGSTPLLSDYQLISEKGSPNGYASLDGTGVVPLAQLPFTTPLEYQGVYDATTNTPTLADGVGTLGHVYVVENSGSAAETRDLGSGTQSFANQDLVIYNGTRWEVSSNVVTSIFTYLAGTLPTSKTEQDILFYSRLASIQQTNAAQGAVVLAGMIEPVELGFIEVGLSDTGSSSEYCPFDTVVSSSGSLFTLEADGSVTVSRAGSYEINPWAGVISTNPDIRVEVNGTVIRTYTDGSLSQAQKPFIFNLQANDNIRIAKDALNADNWYGDASNSSSDVNYARLTLQALSTQSVVLPSQTPLNTPNIATFNVVTSVGVGSGTDISINPTPVFNLGAISVSGAEITVPAGTYSMEFMPSLDFSDLSAFAVVQFVSSPTNIAYNENLGNIVIPLSSTAYGTATGQKSLRMIKTFASDSTFKVRITNVSAGTVDIFGESYLVIEQLASKIANV